MRLLVFGAAVLVLLLALLVLALGIASGLGLIELRFGAPS
ncbi:hypothetical protein FHR83_003756 [Actinoplanes campanulatus]|uniref:Uncharacterized protein n=1 Tax=Actinoplanes campanulatus TaxID=113559 RepID=A0A7W5FF39_9ACTN|nr:hypothetical protein [Actinoplanes campanulatus]GGN13582.1 hypothetical protein GCM10010109_24700 [Actinoplanes campanulatus]GID36820.1 hypothetical protein Aca09nite_33260 [Actinoplanes campanulatus]